MKKNYKKYYQHFIVDWMDSTGSLDDGAYRVYHVIIQKIYENEGAIACNETGLAGLCNQHLLAFRKNLKTLLNLGKLRLTRGRLSNNRAATELKRLANHRTSKQAGDEVAGRVRRDKASKPLESNEVAPADAHILKREEKRKEESQKLVEPPPRDLLGDAPAAPTKRGTRLPAGWMPTVFDMDKAKAVLGANVDIELEKFRDFWQAKAGKDALKADWDATWRYWFNNARGHAHGKAKSDNPRSGSIVAALHRRIAKAESEEENPD